MKKTITITNSNIAIDVEGIMDTCKGIRYNLTNFVIHTNNTMLMVVDVYDIANAISSELNLSCFGGSGYVERCLMAAIQSNIGERTDTIGRLGDIEYWAVKVDTFSHNKYADYKVSIKQWDTL